MAAWDLYGAPAPRRAQPTSDWDTYDERPRPLGEAGEPSVGRPGAAAVMAGLALGSHFDDASWRRVLRARGWCPALVGDLPGFASPRLPDGSMVLFGAPALAAGGLDDTPFRFGFVDADGTQQLWHVVPHGDGELLFDRLAHAGAGFERADFLAWLSRESMADAVRL